MKKSNFIKSALAALCSIPFGRSMGGTKPPTEVATEPLPIEETKKAKQENKSHFYSMDANGLVSVDGVEFMQLSKEKMKSDEEYSKLTENLTPQDFNLIRRQVKAGTFVDLMDTLEKKEAGEPLL